MEDILDFCEELPTSENKEFSEKSDESSKFRILFQQQVEKRKSLEKLAHKATRDYDDLKFRYREATKIIDILQEKLNDTEKNLRNLQNVSEAVYHEYDDLKIRYDVEHNTMSKAFSKATEWYKENKSLRRETANLRRQSAIYRQKLDEDLEFDFAQMDKMPEEETIVDSDDQYVSELLKKIKDLQTEVLTLSSDLMKTKQSDFEAQEEIIDLRKQLEDYEVTVPEFKARRDHVVLSRQNAILNSELTSDELYRKTVMQVEALTTQLLQEKENNRRLVESMENDLQIHNGNDVKDCTLLNEKYILLKKEIPVMETNANVEESNYLKSQNQNLKEEQAEKDSSDNASSIHMPTNKILNKTQTFICGRKSHPPPSKMKGKNIIPLPVHLETNSLNTSFEIPITDVQYKMSRISPSVSEFTIPQPPLPPSILPSSAIPQATPLPFLPSSTILPSPSFITSSNTPQTPPPPSILPSSNIPHPPPSPSILSLYNIPHPPPPHLPSYIKRPQSLPLTDPPKCMSSVIPPPPPPPPPPPVINPSAVNILGNLIGAKKNNIQELESIKAPAMDDLIDQIKRGGIHLKKTPKNGLTRRIRPLESDKTEEDAVNEMKFILDSMKKNRSVKIIPNYKSFENSQVSTTIPNEYNGFPSPPKFENDYSLASQVLRKNKNLAENGLKKEIIADVSRNTSDLLNIDFNIKRNSIKFAIDKKNQKIIKLPEFTPLYSNKN